MNISHNTSLETFIAEQARYYRSLWQKELCDSEDIEKYGFNEFVGGKADAQADADSGKGKFLHGDSV